MTFTINELAREVARRINKLVKEEECETFAELKQRDWLTSEDVKDEIRYELNEINEKSNQNVWLSEDGSFVNIGYEQIAYKPFNRLVMKYVD